MSDTDNDTAPQLPVLIAGGGPVGLAMAALWALSLLGLRYTPW